MIWTCLSSIAIGLLVAAPATWAARHFGRRLRALDAPGVAGQVKAAIRSVPNTGGVGVFLGVAIPLLAALVFGASLLPAELVPQLESRRMTGVILLACTLGMHVLGLIDDRRPLKAMLKLAVMLALACVCVIWTDTRLLTLLDAPAGGSWASIVITVLWIGVIANAFNFMDNMDGLSAGVGAIAAGFFLAIALLGKQWFVGAALALLVGALLGFLLFNFPFVPRRKLADGRTVGGASIFMGDGGSLVVGFLIAVLSVRLTYLVPETTKGWGGGKGWGAVMMPLVILAVPIYDFVSVVIIRLSQGKSPFVGDLQHFSHRLVRHGLSSRQAVLVIYGCVGITGIGALLLPGASDTHAVLVGVQTLLVLVVIALYEYARGQTGGET